MFFIVKSQYVLQLIPPILINRKQFCLFTSSKGLNLRILYRLNQYTILNFILSLFYYFIKSS